MRQLGVDLPAAAEPAELVVRPLDRRLAVRVVADRELPDAGLAAAAVPVEGVQQLRLRLGGDHQVGQFARELRRPLAGDGDPDRRGAVRQVPQLGGLHVEVGAVVGDVTAVEQRPDDLHGLPEHLVPHVHGRPAAAHHVLVEVLARAQPQPGTGPRTATASSPPSAPPPPGGTGTSGGSRASSAGCATSPGPPRRARSTRTGSDPARAATGSSGRRSPRSRSRPPRPAPHGRPVHGGRPARSSSCIRFAP
ncbi:hypothetical protein SFUMM280S_05052 [Streptomyces fumanus]